MDTEELRRVLGLLHQEETRRAFAALVLGRPGEREAPAETLARLARGGLAVQQDGRWRARPERFSELLKTLAPEPDRLSPEEKTLRAFLVDGRLREMPAKHDSRMTVLRRLSQAFEPGVRYPEREVNAALRAFREDYPSLRRYLVEAGLLSREGNVYWRGGPADRPEPG